LAARAINAVTETKEVLTMRKQRSMVAVTAAVLSLAGGGGVAWACTGGGDPGATGTTGTGTTTTTSSTGTTGTTGTTSAATLARTKKHSTRHVKRHSARH
jgi:hypothetical protein